MSDDAFEISCPRCGGIAEFDEPYDWYPAKKAPPKSDKRRQFKFGGAIALEKYPTVFPWRPPVVRPHLLPSPGLTRAPYRFNREGVRKCRICKEITRHLLRWPKDAYYRWKIGRSELWAWNRKHAQVLLEYLSAKLRKPMDYPGYRNALEKLPREVMRSTSREKAIRRISSSLGMPSDLAGIRREGARKSR